MTQQPLARKASRRQREITSMSGTWMRRVGVATSIWGVVFAVVHFYWAAGGSAGGQGGAGPGLAASLYIAFIAMLGLLGAVVAHGLSQPGGERRQRRRLVLLARAGGALLLAGVAVGVAQWIVTASIDAGGADGVVITAYFLIGGLLFSTLGWWREPARLAVSTPAAGVSSPEEAT